VTENARDEPASNESAKDYREEIVRFVHRKSSGYRKSSLNAIKGKRRKVKE